MVQRNRAVFSLFCLFLLLLTYTAIDQQFVYPIDPDPGESLEPGISFGLFKKAAVQVDAEIFSAYELTLSAQAPLLDGNATSSLTAPLFALNGDEDDIFACTEIEEQKLANKTALVRRGKCSLLDKLHNCQLAGAVSVVISGDMPVGAEEDDSELLGLRYPFSVEIPGLVISSTHYRVLLNRTGEDASVWSLSTPATASLTQLAILLFFRPLVMLSIILIFVSMNLRNRDLPKKASAEVVSALPVRNWDGNVNGFEQTQCSICLEEFEMGADVLTLPCDHDFHKKCVSEWLLQERGMCPLCKIEIDESSVGLEP